MTSHSRSVVVKLISAGLAGVVETGVCYLVSLTRWHGAAVVLLTPAREVLDRVDPFCSIWNRCWSVGLAINGLLVTLLAFILFASSNMLRFAPRDE